MSDPSKNRVTEYRYNGDGQLTQLIARNAATGDQVTEWIYGTTLSESGVASSLLVRAKKYPDSSSGSDRVEFKYNRRGQVTEIKDQAGTVHVGEYDALGRLLHDRVTVLGSGVDGTVRRLSASYNVRGLFDHVTSYDNATVGAGSVINDVKLTYNDFNQMLVEAQAHDGAVGSGSPLVQYSYANGSNLTARRTGVTYPNGRTIATGYGTGGGLDDLNSRIASFDEWGTPIATYLRRGINATVKVQYVEPEVELTYIKLSGEPNGDGGDQYTGLDRFNRIVDIRWLQGAEHTAVDRYQYGFDRASDRRYRHNATGSGWDEYYTYDGLYQLKDLQRGTLNGTNTGITGTPSLEEGFTFDPTGNWSNYLTKVAGSTTLNQNRTHNPVNEIATIAGSGSTVGYDPAGNMTTMPKVGAWGTAQTLKWDAWNRLVEIREGSTPIGQYRYDGLFRRITKASVENTYLGNTWQTRHYYYSDQWQVLEERLETEIYAARQFVWGARYRDDLILRDRYDEAALSSSSEEPHDGRLYVTHDQWHVTSVLQPDGTVFERYAYDAFGGSIVLGPDYSVRDESICSWETRYGAYRFDPESRLYQVRFRFLHSGLGRWISRDPLPIAELVQKGSLYAYAEGNCTNITDPTGLAVFAIPEFGLGEILGSTAAAIEEAAAAIASSAAAAAAAEGAAIAGTAVGGFWAGERIGDWIVNIGVIDWAWDAVESRMRRRRKWSCIAKCNVQKIDPKACCPDTVQGYGEGPSLSIAELVAERDANTKVPRGCYKRHCGFRCVKN
jgi:RHS repeat-associated protein